MPAEDELVGKIVEGNEHAMEQLVKKHYKEIFAYVYRTVGDYHLAYDLTQEVFMKMLKFIKHYQGRGKFSHWLITIAVNHCRDYFRSKYFKQKTKEKELLQQIPGKQDYPWDFVRKEFESEKVKQALEQLPIYQREPIVLRFYHDYKIKEIAEMTKANESTVKSRIRQGMMKLKRMLEGRNFVDVFKEKESNYPS